MEQWPKQWEVIRRGGPVIATAIHMGHLIAPRLEPYLFADDEVLRRDEDPLTGIWAGVGDDVFRTHTSRFEVDLNRPRDKAFSADPADTWDIRIYKEPPPREVVEQSLAQHDCFYELMTRWIETRIAEHGRILLLDFHSYNHQRHGTAAPREENPDVDLGMTTLDRGRFGAVAERFRETLCREHVETRPLDVRTNVRYPDGGHFPEWVFERYGEQVCTITLEVKKFYMDERSGLASLRAVDDLLKAVWQAKEAASMELKGVR